MSRRLLFVAIAVGGCTIKQAPPPPGYYPRPAYSSAPPPGNYDPTAPEYGGATYGVGYSDPYAPYGGAPDRKERQFSFNGHAATAQDLQTLAQIERWFARPTPEGDFWYDATSGAAGVWGGPTLGFFPPKLALGGALPANASGGKTGVFINGREAHPIDLQMIAYLWGPLSTGRYFQDAQGNLGPEGGVAIVNLIVLAKQRGRGPQAYFRSDARGNYAFVGGACVRVTGTGLARSYAFASC